jgi:hypothetical protein
MPSSPRSNDGGKVGIPDNPGAWLTIFTVSRELGHGSESLVKRISGHLGTVRHRARVAEFRVDQHQTVLREQLAGLRSGAGEH